MKGFKVFNNDWTCRGFQFEVGKVFEEDVGPKCCEKGFHFCTNAADCFKYYSFDSKNKVAEIEALGVIDANEDDSKCCTNKIRIVRELTWHEVLDLVNTGRGNTGFDNIGGHNTGNHNHGSYNTGKNNSGNRNSGDYNTGYWNTGHYNTGDRNTGDYNKGDHNTGRSNDGNYNSGKYNSGNLNTGNSNTGHHNSGDNNNGNWNTGDWNSGERNNGCFNTVSQKLFFFNKPSEWSFVDWWYSDARFILREMNFTDNKQAWWDNLSYRDKKIVMKLPNFDKEIFKKITGIEIKDKNLIDSI